MKRLVVVFSMAILTITAFTITAPAEDASYDTYTARYGMDIPGMGPVWVGIKEAKDQGGNGYVTADALWVGGSVVPTNYAGKIDMGDSSGYLIQRMSQIVRERDSNRRPTKTDTVSDNLVISGYGNYVEGMFYIPPRNDNENMRVLEFSGKKLPALPDAPDLSTVKYGKPIDLLNGKNLDGWKLTNENQTNGWSVKDGVLHNDPKQTPGQPHISYGNLRTEAAFEDFNLKLEVNVPKNGNSGVYLRGIYEVQVADSYGKNRDSHHMGAVYSRITPSESAEKPAGEWQTLDITLYQRHATVILNGKTIIDNHPLLGCTGGAMTTDQSKAGPIYLQGDHEAVAYKNMVLTPIEE